MKMGIPTLAAPVPVGQTLSGDLGKDKTARKREKVSMFYKLWGNKMKLIYFYFNILQ